jgi:signal transduction histidine kinase
VTPQPRRSVFRVLVTSYAVFAVGLFLSLTVALFVTLMALSRSVLPYFTLFALADEPDSAAARTALNVGMWAEGLDADFNVIEVRGVKLDAPMSYTLAELIAYTDVRDQAAWPEATEFEGFLKTVDGPGELRYWLTKINRDDLATEPSFVISATEGTFQPFFFLFAGVALVLVGGCTLGLSRYLRRRIKRPLDALAEGLERIEAGERDVRLDVKADREFSAILASFDRMAVRLREEQARREEAERRKNQLLLDLSHDIKTPLATIQAYSRALQEGVAGPDKAGQYLETIEAKAGRVTDLSDDLFTILSMDNQDYPLAAAPADLAELVRVACAAHYEQFGEAGLTLTVAVPDGPVEVVADAGLVRRAVDNLLGNALKYDTAGDGVEVTLTRGSDGVTVTVADDGAAIPEAAQETMFDAFARGDRARSSAEGTGLGLTIARAVAVKHGGRLEYRREGGWNRFELTLPG